MHTRNEGEWTIYESDDGKIRISIHIDTKTEFQKIHGKESLDALIQNEIEGANERGEEIRKAQSDLAETAEESKTLRSKLGI
jgi:hypothetical protein